jgi:hypothetical protein
MEKQLDSVHNQGLRIVIGTFSVTKNNEIFREVGVSSLRELLERSNNDYKVKKLRDTLASIAGSANQHHL